MFFFAAVCLLLIPHISLMEANEYSTSASGKISCQMIDGSIEPLTKVRVKLMDRGSYQNEILNQSRSHQDGSFVLSEFVSKTSITQNPFIQIVYSYKGKYGNMNVEGLAGITRKHNINTQTYKRNLDFGNIMIADDHCRAYVVFYEALKDYYKRTGSKVPYKTLSIHTHVLIHGGTPYAIRSTVNIPKGYHLSAKTAMHELGHTIRHTLDGSLPHFLFDVLRFNYMRQHTCNTKSNLGYAFNEGWAEFWSHSCKGSYGSFPTDYTIEGNVAIALRNLKKLCRLTDKQMIDVLKDNPKKIHSFQDYEKLSGCI